MSAVFHRWSRSLVAALVALTLMSVVPIVGADVANARPPAPPQTHV